MHINIPSLKKRFYLIASVCFLVWMLFFDPNNLRAQLKSYKEVKEEQKKVEFYKKNIKELSHKSQFILEDIHELERYAREKFYMKKTTEDVYVMPLENKE
jgi:cell division protein DivIC